VCVRTCVRVCVRARGCLCVRACLCVYLFKGHLTFRVLELEELFIPDVVRIAAHCRKVRTVSGYSPYSVCRRCAQGYHVL
jgi:hypothetical protein